MNPPAKGRPAYGFPYDRAAHALWAVTFHSRPIATASRMLEATMKSASAADGLLQMATSTTSATAALARGQSARAKTASSANCRGRSSGSQDRNPSPRSPAGERFAESCWSQVR